jgi:type VI secretion system protein ImpA
MPAALADIDIPALLTPFAGDKPAGADPREDFSPQSPFRALRTALRTARDAERAAETADPGANQAAPPDWRPVRQLSVKLLAGTCKDLEVAAWLTEALVRAEGLAGLTAGAKLIAGLVRTFWEQGLLPPIDQDGIKARTAPVEGLSGAPGEGTIIRPLRKVVLFARPDGEPVPLWVFDESMKGRGGTDAKGAKLRMPAWFVPFEELERDARVAGPKVFATLRGEAREALHSVQDMSAAFEAVAGTEAPSISRVRGVLEAILDVAGRFAPPEAAAPDPPPAAAAAEDAGAPASAAIAVAPPAPPSREDMLRELGRIAEFFRRTEPHSPLSYTLDEAVRRGRLTLPELLEELVPDAGARGSILTQLGIKVQKPK